MSEENTSGRRISELAPYSGGLTQAAIDGAAFPVATPGMPGQNFKIGVAEIERALINKQDSLAEGEHIKIEGNTISSTDTIYDDTELREAVERLNSKKWLPNETDNTASTGVEDSACLQVKNAAGLSMKDSANLYMNNNGVLNIGGSGVMNVQDGANLNMSGSTSLNISQGANLNMIDGTNLNMAEGARVSLRGGTCLKAEGNGAVSGLQGNGIHELTSSGLLPGCRVYIVPHNSDINLAVAISPSTKDFFSIGDVFYFFPGEAQGAQTSGYLRLEFQKRPDAASSIVNFSFSCNTVYTFMLVAWRGNIPVFRLVASQMNTNQYV